MATSRDVKFALSNAELPSMREWQAEIDRWDFLSSPALERVTLDENRSSEIEIAGLPGHFLCKREGLAGLLAGDHRNLAGRWQLAYAFIGQGDLVSSIAATIAAVSFATATKGAFFDPEVGLITEFVLMRRGIDQAIAVSCDKLDLYDARYPEGEHHESLERCIFSSQLA